jgi:hypothetical protein
MFGNLIDAPERVNTGRPHTAGGEQGPKKDGLPGCFLLQLARHHLL